MASSTNGNRSRPRTQTPGSQAPGRIDRAGRSRRNGPATTTRLQRYEREWRAANPRAEPSAEQIRSWDTRGWEDARPAKAKNATRGQDCEDEWITELRTLGIDIEAHRTARPTAVKAATIGAVGRTAAADRALAVLGSGARGRSTWCVFDIRGSVEEVLSKMDVFGDPAGYQEMAEDITARVLDKCLSVVEQQRVPEHIRHLTSESVIELRRYHRPVGGPRSHRIPAGDGRGTGRCVGPTGRPAGRAAAVG